MVSQSFWPLPAFCLVRSAWNAARSVVRLERLSDMQQHDATSNLTTRFYLVVASGFRGCDEKLLLSESGRGLACEIAVVANGDCGSRHPETSSLAVRQELAKRRAPIIYTPAPMQRAACERRRVPSPAKAG